MSEELRAAAKIRRDLIKRVKASAYKHWRTHFDPSDGCRKTYFDGKLEKVEYVRGFHKSDTGSKT